MGAAVLTYACRYYADNSDGGLFASSDAVYVLAFATIMLNTDAHNPNVKKENKVHSQILCEVCILTGSVSFIDE